MRSDFYSLPWAAQQAIRRGITAQHEAEQRAWSISELRAKITELEKQLAEANATIAALTQEKGTYPLPTCTEGCSQRGDRPAGEAE
jgi:hypothetical protein